MKRITFGGRPLRPFIIKRDGMVMRREWHEVVGRVSRGTNGGWQRSWGGRTFTDYPTREAAAESMWHDFLQGRKPRLRDGESSR